MDLLLENILSETESTRRIQIDTCVVYPCFDLFNLFTIGIKIVKMFLAFRVWIGFYACKNFASVARQTVSYLNA